MVLDFSGGPKVKTPSFHCSGCGFHSRSGNFHMTQDEVKKKKSIYLLKKKVWYWHKDKKIENGELWMLKKRNQCTVVKLKVFQ